MNRITLPKQKSPARAIRAMCIECMGGSGMQDAKERIRECAATACPLYEFRFGRNPFHTRKPKQQPAPPRTASQGGQ
ncbi:MAG: hypothetical protein GWM98_15470 [Nitrospinaceae bacterium]|nr:hypothetical protein [Nitrospinaceae bacterium]NIR55624.1 hypothetical protein [Nitrospinaceae bacterium]NIS86058.1 hypothetical protein [Nitrospinaceae bacterium]NIT82901.1 hypothetical protein [Nitrospinaceae bacterium]NIU45106.1 hypothetical protein [Nitrospinaceae bacterium]